MKYSVQFLPIADQDIDRISDALIEYPGKAKRLFQEMEKKTKMLEDSPYMWPEYQIKPEYRRMVLEDHLLFYKIDEGERSVYVYRVLYSKMDIPKYLE
jgi:plasmid stabilization system protein ParE